MNPYERTLQDDLSALPEEQQLEMLQVMTLQNIAAQDVITWLRERKLWFEGQSGYRGPIQKAYTSTEDEALRDAIDYLWATLFGDQKVDLIRTTEPQWATEVNGVLEVVLSLTELPEAEEDQLRLSFYAMGGGRPWFGTDTVRLADAKVEYEQALADAEADEAAEALKNDLRALAAARIAVVYERIESGEVTSQSGIAAIFAATEISDGGLA